MQPMCVVLQSSQPLPGSMLELLHGHIQSEVLTSDKLAHTASHKGMWVAMATTFFLLG